MVIRKVAALAGICLILIPTSWGLGLPVTRSVDMRDFEDQHTKAYMLPVLVKKESTYELEDRMVLLRIGPQKFRAYRKNGAIQEDKDYFLKVLVSISLDADENGDEDKDGSPQFEGYLNFEYCDESGRLFWDSFGDERADRIGESFHEDTTLRVKNQYFEVTVDVVGFSSSPYACVPGVDVSCESESECLFYIDMLSLQYTIAYSAAQKDVQSKHEEASEYVGTAATLFKAGEFEEAKEEFLKARDVYEQMGDIKRADEVQDQINECTFYIDGYEDLDEGINLFEDSENVEDCNNAIEILEDARSYLENAKTEFEKVDADELVDQCETWMERCDEEIENWEDVCRLRSRLILILVSAALVAGIGVVVGKLRKRKPPTTKRVGLLVRHTETGNQVKIQVNEFDKMGKVRQLAGSKLHIVPSQLMYNGKICSLDNTVKECGLSDGTTLEMVSPKTSKASKAPTKAEMPVGATGGKSQIVYKGQAIEIGGVVTVGRGEDADIEISDPEKTVSRIHASIYRDEKGKYWVEDNNSTNGTYVYQDGEYTKIEKWPLEKGDKIALGRARDVDADILLTFESEELEGERKEEEQKKLEETLVAAEAMIVIDEKLYPLSKKETTIGRSSKADIQVVDPENLVSRIHARILRDEENQYWIEDKNSVHGTFVYQDGKYKKIEKWALYQGDKIGLAYTCDGPRVVLQFVSGS